MRGRAHIKSKRLFRRSRVLIAGIITIFALGAASGCGGSSEKSSDTTKSTAVEMQKVTMGLTPTQDFVSMIVGVKKGWYEDVGIKLVNKQVEFGNVSTILASGAVNITNGCDTSIVSQHDNFPEERMVLPMYFFEGSALMARPNSGLKPISYFLKQNGGDRAQALRDTAAQLKGKTIVTTKSTDMETAAILALEAAGLNPNTDVKWLDLNPAQGLAAFLSGSGDIYIGDMPGRLRSTQEGNIPILTAFDLLPKGEIYCGYMTTAKYAEEHPDIIAKIAKVWYQEQAYIVAPSSGIDGFKIITDYMNQQTGGNLSPEELRDTVWNKLEYFPTSGLEMYKKMFSPSSNRYWLPRYQYLVKMYKDTGRLKKPINLKEIMVADKYNALFLRMYEPTVCENLPEACAAWTGSVPKA
jgi:NitT/TauT family transport system substrate-binding protein